MGIVPSRGILAYTTFGSLCAAKVQVNVLEMLGMALDSYARLVFREDDPVSAENRVLLR